jgi:hypothetical protein
MSILAYQIGVLYPGFEDAPRARLAEVFGSFGFERAQHTATDIDRHRALSVVIRKVGSHRKDGLRASVVRPPLHYQIEEAAPDGVAPYVVGARIFSEPSGIVIVAPAHGPALRKSEALAERIRRRANRLVTHADTRAVSRAVKAMVEEARAFRFIARGSYMLRAADPVSGRLVQCLRALREAFYDEERRVGLRASVVEILDKPDNRHAVADAVTDDAERQIALLVQQLEEDSHSESLRPETLEKRRRTLSAFRESLVSVQDLMGPWFLPTEARARAILGAYDSASSGLELSVPLSLEPMHKQNKQRSLALPRGLS